MSHDLNVAVALEGAGWHPAAWREAAARPDELTTLGYWRDLVLAAERGGVDLVTIEDSFVLQGDEAGGAASEPGTAPEPVRGRLDALLVASALAPLTTRIGLVPTITTTHTEPFHVATGVQTLDHASEGRAGWRVQVGTGAAEARLFGRRDVPDLSTTELLAPENAALLADVFVEAADVVEVARRLWDSWEDDAVIRDLPTGRYLDRDKIHGAGFAGRWFSVDGASIVPRSPQGQPPVFVLAHRAEPVELAVAQADVVTLTPHDDEQAAALIAEVRDTERRLERAGPPLLVFADLLVLLEDTAAEARVELARLDRLAPTPPSSDALVLATDVAGLVDRLRTWRGLGYAGVRLRPARLPEDLDRVATQLLPALTAAGLRDAVDADARPTLREALGLPVATNRHASAAPADAPAGRTPGGAARTDLEESRA